MFLSLPFLSRGVWDVLLYVVLLIFRQCGMSGSSFDRADFPELNMLQNIKHNICENKSYDKCSWA